MKNLKKDLIELFFTIRSCKKQNIPDKIILEYVFEKINKLITKNYY